MSNNDGEVDNKILQGLLPDTARAYVFDGGTIQNTHYLGIVKNARHVAGALVAINFMVSPEAQYEKMKPAVWGDGTILAIGEAARALAAALRRRPRPPLRAEAFRDPGARRSWSWRPST